MKKIKISLHAFFNNKIILQIVKDKNPLDYKPNQTHATPHLTATRETFDGKQTIHLSPRPSSELHQPHSWWWHNDSTARDHLYSLQILEEDELEYCSHSADI